MSSYTVLNPATQGWDVVQSYSYAHKVIQIGQSPIGVLVWGLGSLQRRSAQNLIEEFSQDYIPHTSTPTVEDIARHLAGFMHRVYLLDHPDPQQQPLFGCLAGGYDSTSPFARQWAFEFPGQVQPIEIQPDTASQPQFGVQWFGQTDALVRLHNGFDLRLVQALKDKGFDPVKVDDFFSAQNLFAAKIPYNVIFDGMPLQDAIDYAAYLIHVVKGRFRFVVGPKLCGGPVDIAVVRTTGLEWVRLKKLNHEGEI